MCVRTSVCDTTALCRGRACCARKISIYSGGVPVLREALARQARRARKARLKKMKLPTRLAFLARLARIANNEICFTLHGYRERRMGKGESRHSWDGLVRTSTVLTVLPGFLSHGEPHNSPHQSGGSNCLPARPQGVRRLRRTLGVRRKETHD